MNDELHRSIGKLEGHMEAVKKDVAEIKSDVKALNQFKWRVAGGAAALSIFLTAAIELIHLVKGN